MASAVLALLVKVGRGAQYLGAADAVLTVVETGLERAGAIQPGTKLLQEGANLVMDAAGVPRRPRLGAAPAASTTPPSSVANLLAAPPPPAASSSASAPALGHAPPANPNTRRVLCPECLAGQVFLAGAGEPIALVRCPDHETKTRTTLDQVEALYIGYAQAWGVDLAGCGGKPNKNDFKNEWGNVKQEEYLTALTNWQQCIADDKAAKQKAKETAAAWKAKDAKEDAKQAAQAKKHEADAVAKAKATQKRVASQGLSWQKMRYAKQIQDLQAKYAAEKDATAKAALDKQIQDLTQQKLDAERVANEIAQQARDADHQAQIDRLQAEVAAAAQKPGGMDEMFKMVVMARMMNPAAAVDPAAMMMMAQPASVMDPAAMVAQSSGDPMAAMMMQAQASDNSGYNMDFEGHDEADPFDSELAQAMRLGDAPTYGDAEALFNLRENFPEVDTADLFGDQPDNLSGCSLGSCGLSSGTE